MSDLGPEFDHRQPYVLPVVTMDAALSMQARGLVGGDAFDVVMHQRMAENNPLLPDLIGQAMTAMGYVAGSEEAERASTLVALTHELLATAAELQQPFPNAS